MMSRMKRFQRAIVGVAAGLAFGGAVDAKAMDKVDSSDLRDRSSDGVAVQEVDCSGTPSVVLKMANRVESNYINNGMDPDAAEKLVEEKFGVDMACAEPLEARWNQEKEEPAAEIVGLDEVVNESCRLEAEGLYAYKLKKADQLKDQLMEQGVDEREANDKAEDRYGVDRNCDGDIGGMER